MPRHACLDPQDQYAQEEVLVEFEAMAGKVRLVSARDASHDDILPGLDGGQRQALEREILDDYRHPGGARLTAGHLVDARLS